MEIACGWKMGWDELGYQARQRNKGCGRPYSKLIKLGSRAVAVVSIEMMGKVGWVVTLL